MKAIAEVNGTGVAGVMAGRDLASLRAESDAVIFFTSGYARLDVSAATTG